MKKRAAFMSFVLLALFLALTPAASASKTWYVDGVNGNDNNDCLSSPTACQTISHAISLASSRDTITVAPATYTENLTINFSLRIIGSGAATTIVDGGGVGTVFTISSRAAHVLFSQLTIRNGYTQSDGGGIINWGTLTVQHTTISGNTANSGGGIWNYGTLRINHSAISGNILLSESGYGGGIYNWGTLTVNRSTITANSAYDGGGVLSQGLTVVAINNSTLSGNSATWGGGVDFFDDSTATINNSTLSGNSATWGGGGIMNDSMLTINNSTISGNTAGGGIFQSTGYGGSLIQNSVIANNSGGNCIGTLTSNGYNLSSDNTCNFNNTGDLNNTDPKLGFLKNNGGPTQTQALLKGSPAIDAGNPNGCTDSNGNLLKTDQRGYPRPDKYSGRCDIGAFERQHN